MMSARVFVSYSWDTEEHRAWVRHLCSRLVSNGVQVRLDQWYVRAGDSFLKFMEEEIRLADAILIVCTPSYARKSNARQGGVGFEGQIISNAIFRGVEKKCIPIIAMGNTEPGEDYAVPTFLEGIAAIFFHGTDDVELSYDELLRSIYDKPRHVPPPLGKPPLLLSESELEWGTSGGRRVPADLDYTSPLSIDFQSVATAIDAIQALGNPRTWTDFADTRPDGLWMKSDSDALTNTLYAIWAPMVTLYLERVSWERRFASFEDWRSRLQVLLMKAVSDVYQDDDTVSRIEPPIRYTPRVPGWRSRRESDPARYWWQGLSDDRWTKAAREFVTRDPDELPRLMSAQEFRTQYRALFASGDDAAQQSLGLAANALFRFSTAERPVYWRVLAAQALLHHGLLRTRSTTLDCPRTVDDVLLLCSPVDSSGFPLGPADPAAERFESMATTVAASRAYIREMVAPRLLRRLPV
jgi:hypothetical protein